MAGKKNAMGRMRWWIVPWLLLCSSLLLGLDRPGPVQDRRDRFGSLNASDVAVVINSEDPLSEAIGTFYQQARQIPKDQVLRVRFPAHRPDLDPARFLAIRRRLLRETPSHVQVYALAWTTPYRVGCQSITSAISLGLHSRWCAEGCKVTAVSPYFARGDIDRPWDRLRIRPSMLLAASSVDQARALIERGLAADGSRPRGTVYLLSTSDYKRNVRIQNFMLAERLNRPDLQVRFLQKDALKGAADVLGYFTGLIAVPDIATNQFLPGAIADHLTSLGGQLLDSPQMSALRWLEAGATASYGTVVEPCNFPQKFPDPGLVFSYYRRGDSLIESYWRSVAMPGQGVFIGEPLARPWPRTTHPQLRNHASVDASAMRVQ